MQIIGRNLPQLQNEVSSGLDSIKQGLVQNTTAVAPRGLQSIKDSFMSVGLNAVNLDPSSSVQAEAGNVSPGNSLNRYYDDWKLLESFPSIKDELNKLIHPDSEMGNLAASLHKLNSKIGSLTDSPGAQQGIIIIGGRFQPNQPAIMPNTPAIAPGDVLQSQLRALRDMETTVQQSANLYQQLNSSIQRQPIMGIGSGNGNVLKAGEGAAKKAAEEAIQAENTTVDYAEDGADPAPVEEEGWGNEDAHRDEYEFEARLIFGMFKYPAANPLTWGLW